MRIHRWLGASFAIAAGFLFNLAGCDNKNDDKAVKAPNVQVEPKKDNDGKPIAAQPVAHSKEIKLLPFREAVILDPAPQGELRPPDVSCNGKKVAQIFERVANDLWDKANFKDAAGNRVKYQAIVATDLGDVHIDLLCDLAPNHVRNFVCLAWAGYYDGMKFYNTFNKEFVNVKLTYIESGCPKGTGEVGYGSIGYWMRPEFSEKITHEAGTVGACLSGAQNRQEADNTGACRFHILSIAYPSMDGEFTAFGKVSKGLDIVRTINTRPADEFDRPKEAVTIRTVRIEMIRE